MKLTGYGRKEWLGGGIAALILIIIFIICAQFHQVLFLSLAGVTAILYVCIAGFFRDPNRKIPESGNILVSPADGVIHDIELLKDVDENQFFEGKDSVRIGIFLSIFNVHLNRAPCDMEVKDKQYREGKYHDARATAASKENEAMTISCISSVQGRKFPMLIRQISGAIAKRIVCRAEPGMKYCKGDRFGMIKFGSRTELYLPAEPWMELTVKMGDKVSAGETIIAKIVEQDVKKDKNA
jgi:phosphatidylserine decarboxylase